MGKKVLYAILAGALSVSVLAACGEAGDDPASTGDPAVEDVTNEEDQ